MKISQPSHPPLHHEKKEERIVWERTRERESRRRWKGPPIWRRRQRQRQGREEILLCYVQADWWIGELASESESHYNIVYFEPATISALPPNRIRRIIEYVPNEDIDWMDSRNEMKPQKNCRRLEEDNRRISGRLVNIPVYFIIDNWWSESLPLAPNKSRIVHDE